MKTGRHISAALRIAVVVAAVSATGCIFETRTADPPSSGSTWVVPDDPQRVFQNMKTGLEDRTGANYFRSLNDAFTFNPTASDSANPSLGGKFLNWTVDVEKEVTDIILATATKVVVEFTEREQIQDSSDEVKFNVRYQLDITEVSGQVISYRGRAQFTMLNGTAGWQLSRWRDTEAESGFATWGFLRGITRPDQ